MPVLDLTGVTCPLNWVRARLALEPMAPGEELVLRLDPGEPLASVPRSAREDGHEVAVEGRVVRIVKHGAVAADAAPTESGVGHTVERAVEAGAAARRGEER